MAFSPRVQAALDAAGARLIRQTKHYVFALPNGQKVVLSRTASDHRAELNQLKTIRMASQRGVSDVR